MAVGSPFTRNGWNDVLGNDEEEDDDETMPAGFVKVYDWDESTQMWISTGNEMSDKKQVSTGHSVSMSLDGQRVGVASLTRKPQGSAFGIYQAEKEDNWQQTSVWLPVEFVQSVANHSHPHKTKKEKKKSSSLAKTPQNWNPRAPQPEFVMATGGQHYAMSGDDAAKPTRVFRQAEGKWLEMGKGIYRHAAASSTGGVNATHNHNEETTNVVRHVALSHTGHVVAISSWSGSLTCSVSAGHWRGAGAMTSAQVPT